MNKDTHIYDRLREMLGGRLSVAQFNAAKTLIDAEGSRAAFRIALGLNLISQTINAQARRDVNS